MSIFGRSVTSAAVTLSLLGAIVAGGLGAAGCDEPPPAQSTLREADGLRAPARLDAARTALVLVGFQRELVDGGLPLAGADDAVRRARTLLRWARDHHITIVHVRELAARPDAPLFRAGSAGVQPVAELIARGNELEIGASMAGAFARTDLDARLRAYGIDTLVVAGFMTHLAVDGTARDAAVLGYRVAIAGDATATRPLPGPGSSTIGADVVQATALAALADRFADVMSTDDLVALPVAASPRARPGRSRLGADGTGALPGSVRTTTRSRGLDRIVVAQR